MPEQTLRSVAVLSDVHAVLDPLERVLAEPAVRAAELVVVTGDHLWGPQPTEVLQRLTAEGDRLLLLRGNADREVLQMSRGEDVGLADDPVSVWGAQQLRPEHQRLLDAMPEHVELGVEGFGRVHLCHATPRDDQEVALVDSRIERWQEVLDGLPPEVETVVCGHTHMPFVRLAAGRTVVNPGSVGLPYGRPGAHWALLHDGAVSLHRTRLDLAELARTTAATSTMPDVEAWLDAYVVHPSSDVEALAVFGPRDGR
ncbi:metallophosphoesterase family protein [Angustibacter aerolatus]